MRCALLTTFAAFCFSSPTLAEKLSSDSVQGDYLESRSCDVYTGPCFANAEMDLAGKEALMAWKIDRGTWQNVSLDGLGVALVITSTQTLGDDGIFRMKPGKTRAVILVDATATADQQSALVDFVKVTAKEYTEHIVQVRSVPFSLEADFVTGKANFTAGKLAHIQTRGMRKGDCVCTNERVYYQPLIEVENLSPAYSLSMGYQGRELNNRFTNRGIRSSFLATFRR